MAENETSSIGSNVAQAIVQRFSEITKASDAIHKKYK